MARLATLTEYGDIFRFFKEMIAFRKSHPSISRSHFWRDDVHWFGPDGPVDLSSASHTLAFHLSEASANGDDFYVLINASNEPVRLSCSTRIGGQLAKGHRHVRRIASRYFQKRYCWRFCRGHYRNRAAFSRGVVPDGTRMMTNGDFV
jgi:hypothetical protein